MDRELHRGRGPPPRPHRRRRSDPRPIPRIEPIPPAFHLLSSRKVDAEVNNSFYAVALRHRDEGTAMVATIDMRAVQTELRAISSVMSEVTRLMGPQIWQGGSAASFTSDLQDHNRSLNRLMFEVVRTVARVNQSPSTYQTPDIPRVTPAAGRPGVASVSAKGLERLETALTRAADRLPQAARMVRGLLAPAYPDIPSTAPCDRAAAWCRDQSSRTRTRLMYALAENQADPLLAGSSLSPVPDLERFGRKEMAELGRLQGVALTKALDAPNTYTPELISEMARTLRANTKDDGYLTAFFANVPAGSVGKLAYRLHQSHGGSGLTPDDKKIVGDFGTALAALSRRKDGSAPVAHALGPAGADMPGQALLVKLSAPNVRWSSAVLVDLAKAALRWRQKHPSYAITESSGALSGESHTSVTNQPDGRWWDPWGLNKPFGRDPDTKTLREYDPALTILGRISQQQDLTAARTLAATGLESAFTIKDAEKAEPLTWLTRGNGGTYAALLITPDWPDGGTAAGSVIALATTPDKGHEEEAAQNAAEIMKTVAWWNDKGREKVDKLLKKDSPPDWLPWFDILPRTDQAPPGTSSSKHYTAELAPGLRTGLLRMIHLYIPAIGDSNATSGGTDLPSKDPATGRVYVNIAGSDMEGFLRTFAMDDKSWAQIAHDTQLYRQQILAWGMTHGKFDDAIARAGYAEGLLIAAYGKERIANEKLTAQQYQDAQKHLTLLRDASGAILGATPAANIPGVTDAYSMGTGLALEKMTYKAFDKKVKEIQDQHAQYSDQLMLDLARALALTKSGHTGVPEVDALLKKPNLTASEEQAIRQWAMNFEFPVEPHGESMTGRAIVQRMEDPTDHNSSPNGVQP
ncbi:hypothetical protein AGRA3207_003792 [Actinomadura graeca]|uniref:Type III effector protein n=1 Tax=Actinomadura graeca TaxID=2750812 RepID=A0ABX8QVH7_9ACTN|nr:hypothetical protein [Actinomadura graeca]QXJ22738.1 hypothetical protein AGRA3207_003792 [Actinomadura graeca]